MDEDATSDATGLAAGLTVTRVQRPEQRLLAQLERYDFEAFGPTGLRTYDLAVMTEAGAIFVARLGDEIVGGCQLMRMLDEPGFLYVVGYYVRPAWRSRGVGRSFLAAMAAETAKASVEGFILTCSPVNVAAIALYESAGFVNERFIPDFYGEGEDRYILRWRFSQ